MDSINAVFIGADDVACAFINAVDRVNEEKRCVGNLCGPWLGDKKLQNSILEFRNHINTLSNSCTKLALVILFLIILIF